MLYKILGLILTALGIVIIKFFPDSYQHGGMTSSGLLISAILLLSGVSLIIFG